MRLNLYRKLQRKEDRMRVVGMLQFYVVCKGISDKVTLNYKSAEVRVSEKSVQKSTTAKVKARGMFGWF